MPIDKDPVIHLINQAIIWEELAIPIYSSHLKAAMYWSGLPERKRLRIKVGLEVLLRESKSHIHLLKKVRRIYRRLGSKSK